MKIIITLDLGLRKGWQQNDGSNGGRLTLLINMKLDHVEPNYVRKNSPKVNHKYYY